MRFLTYAVILTLIAGCGKVNHEVSGSATAKTESTVWIAYRRMYEEWVSICLEAYGADGSGKVLECRRLAAKRLMDIMVNRDIQEEL